MPSFDTAELRGFADELRAAGPAVTRKVSGSLTRHNNLTATMARANAPKVRPWLSTPAGIHVVPAAGRLTRVVATGIDPRGQYPGIHVEYGTSVTRPQPFLVPAHRQAGQLFIADVGRILQDEL